MDYSKHILKAEEAAKRRNYDFAVQLFQQLLEIDPNVGEARAGLRQALKKRHEAKKGSRLFGMLKGATPLAMAKTLAKAGKHAAAAKSCESYLSSNPMDEEANLLLGVSLESAGFDASALAVFEFLAEIAPKRPEALKRAGAMMYKKGEHAKALAYYERALEADPRDRDAIKARKDLSAEAALSQSRTGDVGHSRELIRDKDEAQRLERGQRMHLSEDELKGELERLEALYADAPSDPDLMVQMAEVLERLRDPEAALDLIERALQYRKDSLDLVAKAGALKVKSIKKAISAADKAGNQAEADRLEGELRQFEISDLRRQLETRPGDAEMRMRLGRALFRMESFDEAAAELQKAVQDPRLKGEALFFLAQCFQAKGFLDLARKEFTRALEARTSIDERAREILYNLGSIAEAQNDQAGARSCYTQIYEVDIGYRDVAAKMEQLK